MITFGGTMITPGLYGDRCTASILRSRGIFSRVHSAEVPLPLNPHLHCIKEHRILPLLNVAQSFLCYSESRFRDICAELGQNRLSIQPEYPFYPNFSYPLEPEKLPYVATAMHICLFFLVAKPLPVSMRFFPASMTLK